jgi:Arc/MetJ-type ribon-helix-helix transcriptional regulator
MSQGSLPTDVADYVAHEVAHGRYLDSNQLVIEALRVHRELRRNHEQLQAQIRQSISEAERGEVALLDIEATIERGRRRLAGG